MQSADIEPFPDWWHFGFRLESREAVRAAYRGFPVDSIAEPLEDEGEGRSLTFRVRDPDGYLIEIYWE